MKDEVRHQVGFLIKRVQQAIRSQMDTVLAGDGLTITQYAVLAHLRETPGLSNAELARRSFVTAPSMIRTVQDLEALAYIARTKNANHQRVVDMSLTKKGEKILDRCDSKVQSIQRKMLDGLSKSDVAQLSRLLLHCADQLESV